MSGGLLALLDDVAALAKVAAASIDDAAGMAAKASAKAAGIVIDDTAVTPRYVVGFAADRELPIVAKIAWGSLKNKILFLLPGALLLSAVAPWAITPLLMAGGVFLCFEGYVKAHEWMTGADVKTTASAMTAASAQELEDARVASAIRTDMILSAEIMAISLATVTGSSFAMQAFVLAVVALLVTAVVYGLVAAIVKADDLGVRLAKRESGFSQALGRMLVTGMPPFLNALSVVGMLAMLWVGGGIILHGLAHYGLTAPEHVLAVAGKAVGGVLPVIGGFVAWLVAAAGAGVFGLVVGWVTAKALDALGVEAH